MVPSLALSGSLALALSLALGSPAALARPLDAAAPASASLVLLPRPNPHPSDLAIPACATYHGILGTRPIHDVYHFSTACPAAPVPLSSDAVVLPSSDAFPHLGPADHHPDLASSVVWLHPTSLDLDLTPESATESAQLAFSPPTAPTTLLLDSLLAPEARWTLPHDQGHLVRLSSSSSSEARAQLALLSSHPAFARLSPVVLPRSPVARPASIATIAATNADERFPAVPPEAVHRIESLLAELRFDPLLSYLLAPLASPHSIQQLRTDLYVLSGHDQSHLAEHQRWVSRHSMSEGGYKAANWLTDQMRGYGLACEQLDYLPGFSPTIECIYRDSALGDDDDDEEEKGHAAAYPANETVVLSAHYDSRGSFGYPTAPGADDDASGTSLVLAIARHLHQYRVRFGRKLVLCLFSGEEQGLLASSWYAQQLRARNEDVALALQVDMVGFRKPGEPMQLARPDVIGLEVAGHLVGNVSEMYVPELVVGYTPACCSDHQSFVTQAYRATWIFERNGAIADPCYHDSCDEVDRPGYDLEQIAAHARVALATVWEVAGGRMA